MVVAWAVGAGAAQSNTSVWDGAYAEAQAGRGKKEYIANCAACHQEGLQGADLAPALKGDEFLLVWNDKSLFELVDRIATTMPQDAPGSLSPQVNADITAYILQVNRFPAGTTELPSDAAAQKAIAITKTK
jgi:mono/diheme cytochrome c family protein